MAKLYTLSHLVVIRDDAEAQSRNWVTDQSDYLVRSLGRGLWSVQLAQRISKLSNITVVRNDKVRCRFVKRYEFWETCKQDGLAVYYGRLMDDREVVHYVSGGDYVIFAR